MACYIREHRVNHQLQAKSIVSSNCQLSIDDSLKYCILTFVLPLFHLSSCEINQKTLQNMSFNKVQIKFWKFSEKKINKKINFTLAWWCACMWIYKVEVICTNFIKAHVCIQDTYDYAIFLKSKQNAVYLV